MAHVVPRPPVRCEVKKRYFPSGDQRGLLLSVPGEVQRSGAPPAVVATHTSLCRRFPASIARVTVIATRFPSGDTAGALTFTTRYQSRSIIARGPLGSRGLGAVPPGCGS